MASPPADKGDASMRARVGAVVERSPVPEFLPDGIYAATWHWFGISVMWGRYEYRFIVDSGYKVEPVLCTLVARNGEYEVIETIDKPAGS